MGWGEFKAAQLKQAFTDFLLNIDLLTPTHNLHTLGKATLQD